MDRWVGRVAMVTGASSGIGHTIARDLAKAGVKVIAAARRLDRLESLATEVSNEKGAVYPIKCDVMKEEDILSAFKFAKEKFNGIDIMINNAGVFSFASLLSSKTEEFKRVLDTNLLALCICSREAYQSMKDKGVDGHIIHINSIAGHYVPNLVNYEVDINVYSCSKFGVTAHTETFRQELVKNKSKIKVTSISPGTVNTEITKTIQPGKQTVMHDKIPRLQTEDISNAVLFVLSTPPHVQFQTTLNIKYKTFVILEHITHIRKPNMDRWVGRVAMVTGASSGIGQAITRDLAKAGIKVVALARRLDRLEELAEEIANENNGEVHAVKCDVTKEDEILAAFQYVNDNLNGVDILVNNAGIVVKSSLLEGSSEDLHKVINTNLMGLCACTREAYKSMKQRGVDDGQIIHINSIAGHKVPNFGPLDVDINIYAVSKFGVTAATETLRLELMNRKSNIKVTSISPGIVFTELFNPLGLGSNQLELLLSMPALRSEDVSNAVLYVLSTPPHVQVHDIIIRAVGEML